MSKIVELFRSSARQLRTTRCLALTALFIALNVTLDLTGLTLKLSPDLRIGFGYLCNASIGMLFGPVVGMLAGVATDVLGYFAGNFTMGGYFPGYTLTAVVGGLIYGLWLYRPSVGIRSDSRGKRIARIVGCKATINLFCNIFMNTLDEKCCFARTGMHPAVLCRTVRVVVSSFGCVHSAVNHTKYCAPPIPRRGFSTKSDIFPVGTLQFVIYSL